jgi:flavin reductase (DIM6/NTAB) family NADH-FMN oxidoreductase RutF
MSREGISQGLAAVPSGVFVLAAGREGRRAAMLASFVQQVGFDPPCLVVAVGRNRPVLDLIGDSGSFALSIMGSDSKESLRRFWKGAPEGVDPFEGLPTRAGATGIPILEDAIAYLECSLRTRLDTGDHVLCVGEVTGGGRIVANAPPMVRIRTNGFEY